MAYKYPDLDAEAFENWFKLGVALHITKEGLINFVLEDNKEQMTQCLKYVYANYGVPEGSTCSSCSIENILRCPTYSICNTGRAGCPFHDSSMRQPRPCPKNICLKVAEMIGNNHRYAKIPWKNTKAELWSSDPFQIAKCFMPQNGYIDISSMEEVDFNGIINVVINTKSLQNKFLHDLSKDNNIAKQARDIGIAFRHSPDLSISSDTLDGYIEVLVDLLSDIKALAIDKNAKRAVEKLITLKTSPLNIQLSTAINVTEEYTKAQLIKLKDETEKGMQRIIQEKLCFFKELTDEIKKNNMLTATSLMRAVKEIKDVGKKECQSLQRHGSIQKRKVSQESKKALAKIRKTAITYQRLQQKERVSESEHYTGLKSDLRSNLITLYREQHTKLPVSPLREENEASLFNIYVEPSVVVKEFDIGPYSKNNEVSKTTCVTRYKDVFNKNGKPCKNIYLCSPAGTGKTSYIKRIALAWCSAHAPDVEGRAHFELEDIETLKNFDFLFVISLRDVIGDECHIDEMIKTHVLEQLPLSYMFVTEFLQEVLASEKCLILIDGLDEWCHPKRKTCSLGESIQPHRKVLEHCTFFTTTRPWKMEALLEGKCKVDQHLEFTRLKEESANKLADRVLVHLNETYGKQCLRFDFDQTLKYNRIQKLKYIPLLLQQLLCVWFAQGRLGKSMCETYGHLLGFLFAHEKRKRRPNTRSIANKRRKSIETAANIPKCIAEEEFCQNHSDLLFALAKLAFDKLLSVEKESSLVFDKSVVSSYLDKDMLDTCIATGILTQSNANRKLLKTECNFAFLHKSYQEYLAALHISLESSQDTIDRVCSVCNSLNTILEFSDMFKFVCGMNHKVANIIANKYEHVISEDQITNYFRNNIGNTFLISRMSMERIHKLVIRCAQECIDGGFERLIMATEDVFINDEMVKSDTWETQTFLINQSIARIKSLSLQSGYNPEVLANALDKLEFSAMKTVQKLFIWGNLQLGGITDMILNCSKSLCCIELCYLTMSDKYVTAIRAIENLQNISFLCVTASHGFIEDLMLHIKERSSTLKQLNLNELKCNDHGQLCEGYELDIGNHKDLQMLLMDKVSVKLVKVNATILNTCMVEWMLKPNAIVSLMNCLEHAPQMERLEITGAENKDDIDKIAQVLPTIKALKFVKLRKIDIGSRIIDLHHESPLECIYLWRVKMTARAIKRLMDIAENSVSLAVLIMLDGCQVEPDAEYCHLKNEIETSGVFEVTRNTDIPGGYAEFHFRRRQ